MIESRMSRDYFWVDTLSHLTNRMVFTFCSTFIYVYIHNYASSHWQVSCLTGSTRFNSASRLFVSVCKPSVPYVTPLHTHTWVEHADLLAPHVNARIKHLAHRPTDGTGGAEGMFSIIKIRKIKSTIEFNCSRTETYGRVCINKWIQDLITIFRMDSFTFFLHNPDQRFIKFAFHHFLLEDSGWRITLHLLHRHLQMNVVRKSLKQVIMTY